MSARKRPAAASTRRTVAPRQVGAGLARVLVPIAAVVLVGGGGLIGYRAWFSKSEAYETYERFAELMLKNRFDEARAMADGDAALGQIAEKEQVYRFAVKMSLKGDILGATYKLDSEETTDGGRRATLRVTQDVRLNPPGTFSAVGTLVRHKHVVTLAKTGDRWKITSFKDEVVKN